MASPLRPPPSGVSSNFHNPDFLGTPVIIVAAVCIPLILLCGVVRIYARSSILKKWRFQDYIFCVNYMTALGFIAFSIPLTLAKPYGYHVWDINVNQVTKTSMLRLQTFSIALGPVLWLSKLSLFGFVIHIFKPVRWFKNSAYVGIVVTGLIFSLYTCTVTMACAPRPGSDLESYITGFRRDACSSPNGLNMIISVIASAVNGLTDLYLLTAAILVNSTLNVTSREMRGVYLIHFMGAIASVCGFLGIAYRIKSFHSADITGYQIPLSVAIILELALTLMIPCMTSFYTIWRHYTCIEITEKVTIGSPSTRFTSSMSYYRKSLTPPPEVKSSWRKTHLSIEDLPFRRASSEYSQVSMRDSRMKALPCTPLPFNVPVAPKTPKSPNSVRSMQLPIMFQDPYR